MSTIRANEPNGNGQRRLGVFRAFVNGYEVAKPSRAWFQDRIILIAISTHGLEEDLPGLPGSRVRQMPCQAGRPSNSRKPAAGIGRRAVTLIGTSRRNYDTDCNPKRQRGGWRSLLALRVKTEDQGHSPIALAVGLAARFGP